MAIKTTYQTETLQMLSPFVNDYIEPVEAFTNDDDLVLTIKINNNLVYIVIHPDEDFALVGISKTTKNYLKFYMNNNIDEFNIDFKKLYDEYENY